ncbi:hypothetical protein L3Y34_017183 [Caenorhabditis briggsae]|uniref:Axoneme-associated protein mst101 n=1 Tax=Caenorhabditis briggsae TaxID=6238 RepID=A0AAE9DGS6_CAEBR|nr:hypothetical protein L3Y34_017183 [Caenorhabditis briggsae]
MGTIQWIVAIFGLMIGLKTISSETSPFCDDYIRCMEQLEIKQHECLALDKNIRLRSSDACSRQKWDQKLELNALHMRRAEVARDCVQKNHQDAMLAESTLDEETRKTCTSLHDKFQFAKGFTSEESTTSSGSRKKRSIKRNKRDAKKSSNSKATECRNAAKLWHKQCSALAKCCPLVEDCKQSTTEIMDQIYEGRHKLHDMHVNNSVSYADTLIRSLPVQEARRNHLKELINAHKQKIAEQKRTIVVFDENEPKKIKQDRSIIVFKEQEAPKEIEKKRSIVVFDQPIQEVKHREDKKTMLLGFKNGKATNQRETKNRVDRKTVLLGFKNGELPKADGNVYVAKDKEDRRYVGTILKNGEAGQKNVAAAKDREDRRYVGTILKNGEAGQEEVKQREDRKTVLLGFRNGEAHPVKHREDKTRLMITLKNGKAAPHPQEAKHREDKRKIIVFKNGEGDKRAQNDALLNALGERYNHLKVAKRDTLIRSLPVAEKKEQQSLAAAKKKDSELSKNFMEALKAYPNRGTDKEKAAFAAKRREAIRDFLKNRRAIFKQTRYGDWPGFPRKKRDIAATVVGAAVSSVVSNLMKNVEESVVQAESEAAKQVQADLDSDQGRILDTVQQKKPASPVVQADVEVIVGNTNATTTTTTAPAGEKKGFFATLFNSFKLFFGTVTNSVGGFFIDVGSRITNFVEKRIKV